MEDFDPNDEYDKCPFILFNGKPTTCRFRKLHMSFWAKVQKVCIPCLMGQRIEEERFQREWIYPEEGGGWYVPYHCYYYTDEPIETTSASTSEEL